MVALWLVDAALITMVQVATQRSQARRWAQFLCSLRKGPHSNNFFIVCFDGRLHKRVNKYPCLEIWLIVALITIVQVATQRSKARRWAQFPCSMRRGHIATIFSLFVLSVCFTEGWMSIPVGISDWWLFCGWWMQRWLQWSRLWLRGAKRGDGLSFPAQWEKGHIATIFSLFVLGVCFTEEWISIPVGRSDWWMLCGYVIWMQHCIDQTWSNLIKKD